MNILIANDDGSEAYGLRLLQEAVRSVYPDAKIVTLAPRLGQGGQGMAITPQAAEEIPVEQIKPDFYVCDGKPADLIYVGLGLPRRFLPEGQFDFVLTGVNHGQNVGMDVFHSGTVGMAMLAAGFFGVPAMAFSQQVEDWTAPVEETTFRTATEQLPRFLQDLRGDRPSCRSINFPSREPKGVRICGLSMFSRFRPHLVPHHRRDEEDVAQLAQGYITISFLRPTMLAAARNDVSADVACMKEQSNSDQMPFRST